MNAHNFTATIAVVVHVLTACGNSEEGAPTVDATALPPDAQCADEEKTIRFPDGDGDGFGDVTDPGGLRCPTPGFVTEHSDCADGDGSAHPAQTEFSTVPVEGAVSTGFAYDFNCDGIQSAQYPTARQPCQFRPLVGCEGAFEAWNEIVPACGESRTWVDYCRRVGMSCVPEGAKARVQACR